MSQPYDIFLACAEKDYAKLPFVITSLIENLEGWNEIHLCTPSKINAGGWPIVQHTDHEVLPSRWLKLPVFKKSWVYQQLLKLAQSVTPCEYYYVLDCDTVLLKPLKLFNNDGKPIWWVGRDQNHSAYYEFSRKLIGIGREHNHTFLGDMNFFYRPYLEELVHANGRTFVGFMEQMCAGVTLTSYPSEADLYMQWVMKNHPDHYAIHKLKTAWCGKEASTAWTPREMGAWIREKRAEGLQTTGIHSYAY